MERGYIATCLESEKVANEVDMYLKGWRVNTIPEVIRGQKPWGMFAKARVTVRCAAHCEPKGCGHKATRCREWTTSWPSNKKQTGFFMHWGTFQSLTLCSLIGIFSLPASPAVLVRTRSVGQSYAGNVVRGRLREL